MCKKHFIKLDMRKFLKNYACDEIVSDYPYLKKIKLYHNPRIRSAFGVAHLNRYSISLSSQTLAETYDNIRETLIHELCHIVAFKSFNDAGHGKMFKSLHRKYLGLEGNPTFHNGILTTDWVKVNGKWIVQRNDNEKWIKANQRLDDMMKKLAIA